MELPLQLLQATEVAGKYLNSSVSVSVQVEQHLCVCVHVCVCTEFVMTKNLFKFSPEVAAAAAARVLVYVSSGCHNNTRAVLTRALSLAT